MNKFNHLNIFIQGNKPLFLTNDVSLAAIVGKMVDYINNLIDRESILESSFNDLNDQWGTFSKHLYFSTKAFSNKINFN